MNKNLLNNFDELYNLIESNNIQLSDKNLKHILYKFNENKKTIKIFEKFFDKFMKDEAYLTIGMRLYLNVNDIDAAYKLLRLIKNPKKRNVLPIFQHYCNNNDDIIFNFYKSNMYEKFLISEEDYLCLIKKYVNENEKLNFIFDDMKNNILSINDSLKDILLLKGNLVTIKNNYCTNCNNKLLSIDLKEKEKLNLKNNIENIYFTKKNNLNNFKNFLLKNKIDIFIDAGNIIYYQGGIINYNSFKKIDIIVKRLENKYNTVVIIHQRHYNNIKKMENKENILKLFNSWKKYETPYNTNDDYYFIYGCLLNDKSFIVTNDKLRDHQFKVSEKTNLNNTLAKLIDRRVINYDFINKKYNADNLELKFPNEYSTEIQKVNNIWHFPINNCCWLCYK